MVKDKYNSIRGTINEIGKNPVYMSEYKSLREHRRILDEDLIQLEMAIGDYRAMKNLGMLSEEEIEEMVLAKEEAAHAKEDLEEDDEYLGKVGRYLIN